MHEINTTTLHKTILSRKFKKTPHITYLLLNFELQVRVDLRTYEVCQSLVPLPQT